MAGKQGKSKEKPARRCKVAPNVVNRLRPPWYIWIPVVEKRFVQHEKAGPHGRTQLQHQWLYVFKEVDGKRTLEYEIYISSHERWYVADTPDVAKEPDQRAAKIAPLRRPSGAPAGSVKIYCALNKRHRWLFFVSRAQLHGAGLDELLKSNDGALLPTVDVSPGIFAPICTAEEVVLVDPYHLAEDVHRFRYQPPLERYLVATTACERWIASKGKQANRDRVEDLKSQVRLKKLLIAKGLIQIMGPTRKYAAMFPHLSAAEKAKLKDKPADPAGIANNLELRPGMLKKTPSNDWEAPYRFVEEFNHDADRLLARAEAALGSSGRSAGGKPLLIDVVKGTAHRIVDDAVLEWPTRGKLPGAAIPDNELPNNADLGVAHWAVLVTHLISTPAGQAFLDEMMRSTGRRWIPQEVAYPARLRSSSNPELIDHVAKGNPWAMQLFLHSVAHVYRDQRRRGGPDSVYKEVADRFLRRQGFTVSWKMLKQQSSLASKLVSQNKRTAQLELMDLETTTKPAGTFHQHAGEADRLQEKIRVFQRWEDALKMLNGIIAVCYVFSQDPVHGTSVRDTASRLKQVADFGSASISVAEVLLARAISEVANNALKAAGQVVGWVGGILSATVAGEDTVRSLKQGDSDAAFFHGVAMVGYVLTSSASIVGSVVYAAGEAAAIPVVGWLVIVGLVLVTFGYLLAKLLEDNMFETFAKNCYFGNKATGPSGQKSWAGDMGAWKAGNLPTSSLNKQRDGLSLQCAALQKLLRQFVVQTVCEPSQDRPGRVGIRIRPGMLSPFTRIEVLLKKTYGPRDRTSTTCSWALRLTVVEVTGARPRAFLAASTDPSRPARLQDARPTELGPETLRVKVNAQGQVEHIDVSPGTDLESMLKTCEASVQLDCFGEISGEKLLVPKQPLQHCVKRDTWVLVPGASARTGEPFVRAGWNAAPTESGKVGT